MSTTPISLPGVPQLDWLDTPGTAAIDEEKKSITITTTKETDWFNPPPGDPSSPTFLSNAPALVFTAPECDWQLSARVTVDHHNLFDAGTIFIHQGNNDWCKLCFEYSPEKIPVVVSVVTRDVSDDANGPPIDTSGTSSVCLRASKYSDSVVAFHYSVDGGKYWTLHRSFSMRRDTTTDVAPLSVGFLAQAPVGDACTAVFSEVEFRETTLTNLRDGS